MFAITSSQPISLHPVCELMFYFKAFDARLPEGNRVSLLQFMSPVSPVFHTAVTVSIAVKNLIESGNIHFIILNVNVGWQSTQTFLLLPPNAS